MDRNTPGLDPATRQQLTDLDQDTLIKHLQDDKKNDDEKLAALLQLLRNLVAHVAEIDKRLNTPAEATAPKAAAQEKSWIDRLLNR